MRLALFEAVAAASVGATKTGEPSQKTYQANGTTTAGSGAATILVQGSNDNGANWDTIGTITLTLGTTTASDSFTSNDRYTHVRGNVTALSGTGASVNLHMGY